MISFPSKYFHTSFYSSHLIFMQMNCVEYVHLSARTHRLCCVLSQGTCHEGEESSSTGLLPNADRDTHLSVTKYFRNIRHFNVRKHLAGAKLQHFSFRDCCLSGKAWRMPLCRFSWSITKLFRHPKGYIKSPIYIRRYRVSLHSYAKTNYNQYSWTIFAQSVFQKFVKNEF